MKIPDFGDQVPNILLFLAGQFKHRLHMATGNNQLVSINDWESIT